MFGIKFIKVQPTTYLLQYRGGKIVREGQGHSFFYYAPTTSLMAVPVASAEVPFIFPGNHGGFPDRHHSRPGHVSRGRTEAAVIATELVRQSAERLFNAESSVELLRKLAEIEHAQWMHWSRAVAANVPPATREKWQRSWVDYAELPDDLKEGDRVWARKVVSLLQQRRLTQ